LLRGRLGPETAGPRAPHTAYGPAQEREEQGQNARDAQDGPEPLLRDGLLGALLRPLGQRHARELVYETDPQQSAYYRQHQRHDKGQQRHQEPVLEAGAGRHATSGVAAYQEGQEERDQEPYKGSGSAFSNSLAPCGAEDGAYYPAYYAAQDEPGPQCGQPTEDDANPARAPVFLQRGRSRSAGGGTSRSSTLAALVLPSLSLICLLPSW
jgi:hypothetical protein